MWLWLGCLAGYTEPPGQCFLSTDLCPQVLPEREAMEVSGLPASTLGLKQPLAGQPSDHSYALLDLDTLKRKLFLTLKENKRLRKRLKAQRLLLWKTCGRLRACRGQQRPLASQPAQLSRAGCGMWGGGNTLAGEGHCLLCTLPLSAARCLEAGSMGCCDWQTSGGGPSTGE